MNNYSPLGNIEVNKIISNSQSLKNKKFYPKNLPNLKLDLLKNEHKRYKENIMSDTLRNSEELKFSMKNIEILKCIGKGRFGDIYLAKLCI